ncbi:MAG TPA: pyridine nucleotide-disulfide oxidoreductase [Proteobacteria bacterium]|nr:pyridine nucleotide-disulfide oxidoreductase [Pseudomonadota bacterium]
MKKDVVIIGGSAAGLMAAVTLRKRNPQKSVTVIRNVVKTPVPCGIPYIYGIMGQVDKDLIPDQGFTDQGIEILQKEVINIDRTRKEVEFSDGERLGYNKLILGTGSKPFTPPLPGIDKVNVFTVRKDPVYLKEIYTALEPSRKVVVIGGGFIGVEMAEQIALMGRRLGAEKTVTVVEMLPHCLMLACEEDFCIEIEKELTHLGVNLKTGVQAAELIGQEKVSGVKLADGQLLDADVVIIGIGAQAEIDLALKCGLEADARGGIKVDKYLRTADPDILAAGDCASKFSCITGNPSGIRLASVACSEGMLAAGNLDGPERATLGALGAFSTMVGKRAVAAAGLTSRAAAAEGIDFVVGEVTAPNRHPGHLPGSIADMKIKLLFRRDNGVIIGGHVSGGEAASDMVNIIAVAIQARLTAEQLAIMQYATHPLLTSSPLSYHVMLAAENAALKLS